MLNFLSTGRGAFQKIDLRRIDKNERISNSNEMNIGGRKYEKTAKGLAVANTTDGETLLKTLYKIKHDGASGSIEFNNLGEIIGRYDYVQLDEVPSVEES